jgi:magnesium transporter
MITAYLNQGTFNSQVITPTNQGLLREAVWIDLLRPSKAEAMMIKNLIDLELPTREDMQEIEPSSRLYKEDGSIFMTATMITKSDSNDPENDAITLILKGNKLITVRYIEPQAFSLFISHLPKLSIENTHAVCLMISLLEATIDRLADISELIGRGLDDYSQTIFRGQSADKIKLDYKLLLQRLGSNGDLTAKVWESLVSFNRLLGFFGQVASTTFDETIRLRLATLGKDISALSDQANFLTSKVNFLLDATLGMVNIEQNNIIKIFSIAAVIFLPPTLIASIYGMNFDIIPELKLRFGYPIAIGLMLLSGWLPYQYFKVKKFL